MFHAAYFFTKNMRFLGHLYIGESIRDSDKIKENLLQNKIQRPVFVISISESSDQLDIMENKYLLQPFLNKDNMLIVGLAGSHEEAVRLVTSMIEKTVRETGTAEVKKYLLSVDQKEREGI